MKYESLKLEWKKDSRIDNTDYEAELLKISRLHSKYWNILGDQTCQFRSQEIQYNRLRKIKREYYLGRLPRTFVKQKGWEPIDHEIGTYDIGDYLKGDADLCKIEERMALQKIKIKFLEDIIQIIHERGYHIKDAINYISAKFGDGGKK